MKTIVEINNNNYGSTGHIMLNIAKAAKNNGYKIYTCCKNSKAAKRFNYEDQIMIGNRYERAISEYLASYTGLKDHFNFFNTKRFLKQLDDIKPDLIHLHNIHDTFINVEMLFKYTQKHNIPIIWTLHDCYSFTGQCTYFDLVNCDKWKDGCKNCPQIHKYPDTKIDKTERLYKLKKDIFTNTKNLTIVTPSKWLSFLASCSFLKDKDIRVINNGINLDIFKPTDSSFKEKYGIKDKYIVLGVSTGWGQRKGLDDFIKLSNVLDENYQIVMVGSDDEIDKTLPKNIISIHRTYDQKELAEIYSAADVFVNPTKEENFPTVNIESIACGTPVITYDTGGSKEMLNDKCGSIVEKNDFNTLVSEIKRICTNHPYSSNDCIKQSKKYEMTDKFQEYVKLYEEILSK